MSNELHFTLTSVAADLRRKCNTASREIGDLQRNAVLWLCVRAGVPAKHSSFALSTAQPLANVSWFSQATYLGALGFLHAVGLVRLPEGDNAHRELRSVLRRNPHTVERSGFADDPLCAMGLLLLAHSLGMADACSIIRTTLDRVALVPPVLALIATLGDPYSTFAATPADVRRAGDLAAVVLAGRVDTAVARKLFPTISLDAAEQQLLQNLCRGSEELGGDLTAMAVLAAIESVPQAGVRLEGTSFMNERRFKATVLFLAANPGSTTRLALDEEARDIEAKIRSAAHRDAMILRTRWAVRPDDLLQALNEDRPTVVHFSGHGVGRPGIVLHDDVGGDRVVQASALRRLFAAVKDKIRVVVLSACYSSEQAHEISGVIDCVIGMKQSIGDSAARKFAASFYRAIGFGRSVANAFEQGLAAIELEGLSDVDVPELFTKPGIDANRIVIVECDTGE